MKKIPTAEKMRMELTADHRPLSTRVRQNEQGFKKGRSTKETGSRLLYLLIPLFLLLFASHVYALDLNYWIEPDASGNPSKVWVKIPSIPANGSVTIYARKEAGYSPNGEGVFIFWDDFSTNTIGTKWQTVCESGDYCDVYNGYLRIGEGSHDNDGLTVATSSKIQITNTVTKIVGKMWKVYTEGSTWEADPEVGYSDTVLQNLQGTSGYTKVGHYLGDDPPQDGQNHCIRDGDNTCDSTGSQGVAYNVDGGTFEEELIITSSEIKASLKRGDGWSETITLSQAPAITEGYYYFNSNGLGDSTYSVYGLMIDYIYVRKYAPSEPTVSVSDKGTYYEITITNPNSTDLTDFQVAIPATDLNVTSTAESIHFSDAPFSNLAVSITHAPTAQSDLALDPENNVTEVNVTYEINTVLEGIDESVYDANYILGTISTSQYPAARAVCTDGNYLYLIGYAKPTSSSIYYDVFVERFDTNGNYIDTHFYGSATATEYGQDCVVMDGNLYISGGAYVFVVRLSDMNLIATISPLSYNPIIQRYKDKLVEARAYYSYADSRYLVQVSMIDPISLQSETYDVNINDVCSNMSAVSLYSGQIVGDNFYLYFGLSCSSIYKVAVVEINLLSMTKTKSVVIDGSTYNAVEYAQGIHYHDNNLYILDRVILSDGSYSYLIYKLDTNLNVIGSTSITEAEAGYRSSEARLAFHNDKVFFIGGTKVMEFTLDLNKLGEKNIGVELYNVSFGGYNKYVDIDGNIYVSMLVVNQGDALVTIELPKERYVISENGADIVSLDTIPSDYTLVRSYSSVGDYNLCVYAEFVVGAEEYNATACDVVHIDEYPQGVDFDWTPKIPFPGEEINFVGEATDNGELTWEWAVGGEPLASLRGIKWRTQYNFSGYDDYAYSVCSDGTYLYVVGYTLDEGDGDSSGESALILKVSRETGEVLDTIRYEAIDHSPDDDYDRSYSCVVVGNYLYVVGYTTGSGSYDLLLLKIDLSSMEVTDLSKSLYSGSYEYYYSVVTDGEYLYVGGIWSDGSNPQLAAVKLTLSGDVVKTYTVQPHTEFGCRTGSDTSYHGIRTYSEFLTLSGDYIYFAGNYICKGDWGGDGSVDDYDDRLVLIKLRKDTMEEEAYTIKDIYTLTTEGGQYEYVFDITVYRGKVFVVGQYSKPDYDAFVAVFSAETLEEEGFTSWDSVYGSGLTNNARKIVVLGNDVVVLGFDRDSSDYYHQTLRILRGETLEQKEVNIVDDGTYNSYFDFGKSYYEDGALYVVGFNGATSNWQLDIYAFSVSGGEEVALVSFSNPGTYPVTLTVTDDVGLSKSVTKEVDVYSYPILILNREDLQLTAEINYDQRLSISAEWNIDGQPTTGNPVTVKLTTRNPKGWVSFTFNSADGNRTMERNLPELNVTYTYNKGFTTDTNLTVNTTTENFEATPTCQTTLNGSTTLTLKDGSNVLKVECNSEKERYTAIDNFTVFLKKIEAVNEDTLNPVDLNDFTTLKLYDNNGNSYDLKANGKTSIYHLSPDKTSIVLEFIYSADASSTTLSRVFSNDLMDSDTKVCIPDFQPFNEVVLYSSTIRPVWVRNATTGCFVAATYTDQLYQDAYATSILVVPKLYSIAVYNEDGERVILGSIFGSKAQAVSLDLLLYKLKPIQTTLIPVVYAIEKENENELRIYITNKAWDNKATEVKIYGPDGKLLFSHYETIQPNDFQIIFDHSTLDLSKDDILKLEIISYKQDGTTRTDTAFFKITGEVGILDSKLGIALAVLTAIISITAVSTSLALGPIGIIGLAISLIITAFTIRTPALIFIQTVLAIAFVYVLFTFRNENSGVV